MPEQIGLYPISLCVFKSMPGAPELMLHLTVFAPNGAVNGYADITQTTTPPPVHIHVPHVTGSIHHTGFGKDEQLISVSGQYAVSVPPPAIGTYLAHFNASLAVDKNWNGKGSFTYNNQTIPDCRVELADRKAEGRPMRAAMG